MRFEPKLPIADQGMAITPLRKATNQEFLWWLKGYVPLKWTVERATFCHQPGNTHWTVLSFLTNGARPNKGRVHHCQHYKEFQSCVAAIG